MGANWCVHDNIIESYHHQTIPFCICSQSPQPTYLLWVWEDNAMQYYAAYSSIDEAGNVVVMASKGKHDSFGETASKDEGGELCKMSFIDPRDGIYAPIEGWVSW